MAKFLFRITVLVAALAGLLVFFFAVVRPWYLRWGATTVETARALPGDDIVGPDAGQETRAITIGAPIDVVWPWLAQLGQDRGGFYSFDVLENLVGCQMPTIDVLRPDHQNWSVGDRLWMYPPNRAGGVGFATLRAYVPGRAMGFGTHMTGTSMDAPDNGSWSFVLDPLGPATTRLLVRGRGTSARSLLASGFDRGIFEPVHFAMERRMMIGLKEIAETGSRRRLRNHAHVLLWTFSFGLMLVAASRVLLGRRWKASLGGFVMAAALFQVLTLVQPALWVGVPLTLLVWLAFANGHVLRG